MGWIDSGRGSGETVVRRERLYVHHVRVSGVCPQCAVPFNGIAFTKDTPDGVFNPVNFTCPCGTFIYDPEDDRIQVKDTGETPEQLRKRYDTAALEARR